MGSITLIRHGQANTGATTEEDYDRLSDLGIQQSKWLGSHMRSLGTTYDHVLCGTLKRHKQTATAMGYDAPEVDGRFDEMDYFRLSQALNDLNGTPLPAPDDFLHHLPRVMQAWQDAEIKGAEDFLSFESRTWHAVEDNATQGAHVLCITSGGVIGMIVRHLLQIDLSRLAHLVLPIYNTSIHQIIVTPHGNLLSGFNAIPHLETEDRHHAHTVV